MAVNAPFQMDCSKLGFHIFVDGNPVWTSYCARPEYKRLTEKNAGWEDIVEGVKEGKGNKCTVKGFRFSRLETTSGSITISKIQRMAQRMKKVGTIEVKVYRETYGKKGGQTDGDSSPLIRKTTDIPEKALKGDAKSHATLLGEAQKITRGPVWTRTDQKDGENRPLVIFRFMYRSEEALKQMMIIERDPEPARNSASPEPEAEDIDFENLTSEQQKRAATLLKSFMQGSKVQSSKKIKREGFETDAGGSGASRKKARLGSNEQALIDLTTESDEDEDDESVFP